MTQNLNILIIDDDSLDRALLSEILKEAESLGGYKFNITESGKLTESYDIIESGEVDLIFLDFLMGDGDGLQFLSDLSKERKKQVPIIFNTGYGNDMIEEDALIVGAKIYLDKKNINKETVASAIKQAFKQLAA